MDDIGFSCAFDVDDVDPPDFQTRYFYDFFFLKHTFKPVQIIIVLHVSNVLHFTIVKKKRIIRFVLS